jgi:hypothetical protein
MLATPPMTSQRGQTSRQLTEQQREGEEKADEAREGLADFFELMSGVVLKTPLVEEE